jgi:response regulator RpfG family c-di-GMP phosphodiesterase
MTGATKKGELLQETVLFVDDNNFTLQVLKDLFAGAPFRVLTAESAAAATEIIRREEIAVVVSDNIMPTTNGLEFLSSLKTLSPTTVKVLMSAYADLDSALAAINRSEVFRYVLKPWQDEDIKATIAAAMNRYRLNQAMRREDEGVMRSLAQTIELKDSSTSGHCDRVAIYAGLLAEALELPNDFQREIKYGSWLHDCGKIGIAEEILNGAGSLSDDEFEKMKQHSLWGAEVAAKANLSTITRNIILYHHEHFDGSGYPAGLAGEAIPLEARLVAVADVFDALVTDRPYRDRYDYPESMEILASMSGTNLDPALVNLFSSTISQDLVESLLNQLDANDETVSPLCPEKLRPSLGIDLG